MGGSGEKVTVLVNVFVGQGVIVSGTEVASTGVEVSGKAAGVSVASTGKTAKEGLVVRVGVGVAEVEDNNQNPAMIASTSTNKAIARANNPTSVKRCLRGGR